jgi:hypothetical protein
MKKLIPLIALSAVFTAAVSATSMSETNSQDKSQYNLFNPTPVDLMRPMYSDQYDGVFDAHTLDAGHIQIESSLINYGEFSERYNYPFGSYHFTEEEYSWSPRFRIGLLNFMDFDVSPTYAVRSYTLSGRIYNPPSYPPFQTFSDRVHSSAFGDVGLGSTINLGNYRFTASILGAVTEDISLFGDCGCQRCNGFTCWKRETWACWFAISHTTSPLVWKTNVHFDYWPVTKRAKSTPLIAFCWPLLKKKPSRMSVEVRRLKKIQRRFKFLVFRSEVLIVAGQLSLAFRFAFIRLQLFIYGCDVPTDFAWKFLFGGNSVNPIKMFSHGHLWYDTRRANFPSTAITCREPGMA